MDVFRKFSYVSCVNQSFEEELKYCLGVLRFFAKVIFLSDAACDIKTTPEHSIQISVERAQGLSQDTCLETAYHVESAAVFCPDEKLCGWDLQINRTAELKYLSMKSCQVFMKKRIDCALFEHKLRQSGESNLIDYHFCCLFTRS